MAQPAAVLSILITANSNQAVRGIARLNTSLAATQASGNKAVGAIKAVAKAGAIGAAGGLAFAVKKAADFEQQLDSLGSVSGATGRDMERFRKQAMKAGADTKFSALDAAAAQTELAKGGLSVRNIMKGGLRSALALAAAGEMELAEAAATTANSMKLFGLEGKDSMKVANMLAAAANSTTADVKDFSMALKQSGGVAKTVGLSFKENVLWLELLAEAGVKNSDAGTSLKTSLIQLVKPSKKQAELAKELGLNFIDSAGNMKTAAVMSEMLQDKLGGMTKAQRANALATLAGTDGVRTLVALYDASAPKIGKFSKGLDDTTRAATVAAQKQDNLKGKLENLQGSIETIAIAIGSKMLPALTDAAEKVTGILNDPKLTAGEKFNKLAGMLGKAFEKGLTAAVEAAAKAGPKIAAALAKGFAQWWYGANPLTKLFGVAAVIRLFGGKGALMATGAAVGRLLGIGVATGTATAAAGTAGGAAAGGLLGAMRGKLLPLAKRAGLVGLGLVLADGVISEFGKRAAAKGPDLFKALKAKQGSSSGGPFPAGLRAVPGIGAFTELSESEKAARDLVPALEAIAKSAKGIDAGKARELGGELSKIGGLSDEARAQFTALVDHALRKGEDIKAFRAGFQWIKVNGMRDMDALRENVDRNARLIGKSLEEHPAKARKALDRNFGLALDSIQTMMRKGKISAKEGMKAIEHFARVHSDGSKDSIARNMELAKDAIFRTMSRAGQITEAGMKRIYDITVAQLALYGLSPEAALKGNIPQLKPLQNLGGSPTPRGGVPNNPPPLFPLKQRGGGVNVPGRGSGDKVMLRAMVEPGEKVFVLNRNASSTLDQLQTLNQKVPRFQQGGVVGAINVGGPDSGLKSLVQVALERTRAGANSVIRGAAQAAAAPAGGETSTEGLVSQVLRALAFARANGWTGSVISGFRSEAEQVRIWNSGIRPAAKPKSLGGPGSNHSLGQAIDVSDSATFDRLMDLAPRNAQLYNNVPNDFHHFSVTGHQLGGLVGLQSGGAITLAPDVGKAVVQWGPKIGWLARQRYADKLREPEGVDLLGKLTAGENRGQMGGAPSDAGARGAFQFIASTRSDVMSKFGLDPWRSANEAAQAAVLHLAGKLGHNLGLEGYNPGGGQGYVNYILGQNYRFPPGVGGGSGTPSAAVERAQKLADKRTAKFKRKLAHVKRPVHKLLDKVQGVGIPEGLKDRIGGLTKKSEVYGEFADRTGQLNLERLTEAGESVLDAEGRPITDLGLIDGKNETEWLTKQLDVLFKLRNALVRAHNLVVDYREQLSGAIERAKVKLAAVNKKLGRKGLGQQERRKLLLERGGLRKLVGGLEGRREKTNTSRGNILEALEGVQGHPTGSALTRLLSLPPLGILGGQIFDTQVRLKELGVKPAISDAATPEVSESAELLRGLLRDANLRTAVSQAQYPEFLRYMGAFAKGGVALVGERGPELAHMPSGTRVHSSSDTQAMLAPNVSVVVNGDIVGTPRGKDPVEVLLNDRRFDAAVRNVRSSRPRPGRAGGR